MAEGEECELSVRSCCAKAGHIPRLQKVKNSRENFASKPRFKLVNQSGFDSPFIRSSRRTSDDSVAESGQLTLCDGRIGYRATACRACSPQLASRSPSSKKSLIRDLHNSE